MKIHQNEIVTPMEDMPGSEVTNDASQGGKFSIIIHAGEDGLLNVNWRCP